MNNQIKAKSMLAESLKLPCGVVLKNRIAKSAMSENMATSNHEANELFVKSYKIWSQGGAGLLISGNVMVDSRYLGEPDNIVIEKGHEGLQRLKEWTKAGALNNTHLWIQLNHPGKQSPKFLSKEPVAPSAIPFRSSLAKLFNTPRALLESEIEEIIERFTFSAVVARDAGFTGAQIHGAHGYLVSQFLSPLHNQRTDQWGGTLENRMRFVMKIYHSMRKALGASFPISIKLNSADFQKGGFTEDESILVAQKLSEAGMDLIEISGGTYEVPKMTGTLKMNEKESTLKREAYFLEYCEKVRSQIRCPIMLTGGFRTSTGMEHALSSQACDLIGLARSLAINPSFPKQLLSGQNTVSEVKPLTTGFKNLDKVMPLEIVWYTQQIHRMGHGLTPSAKLSPLWMALNSLFKLGIKSLFRVRSNS